MTLGQILRSTAKAFEARPAFVTLGKDFLSWSYGEVYDRVGKCAAALAAAGLTRGDRVSIISENSPDWAIVGWACHCSGLVLVPIYPSLPADQMEHILRDSGAKLAVCGADEQFEKVRSLDGVQSMLMKGPNSLQGDADLRTPQNFDLDAAIDGTNPEDPCSIIYTSGTTGLPKGAVMPHRAFAHVCMAAPDVLDLSENDSFLGFLPMSHVYEWVAGQCLPASLGSTICFSKGLASLATEMRNFKPTIMFCVPRFLESLRDRVVDQIAKESPLKQKIFALGLSQGVKRARGEFAPLFPLTDRLVGKKIRERTGGRIRFLVSGGAALAPVVAEFYMAMGIGVLQGYGLTETSGGSCINRPGNNKYWTVGEPLAVEVKVAEDGEILIRGPAVMLGYHNMPDETARAIDPEGWFHTGDIGEFEGKSLKITDRKKDILVLANGKNIAPQKLENLLKASDLIQEAVVVGDGMDHCAALIIPNFEAVRRAAALSEEEVLSQSREACALIKREVDRINKTLANFEMIKKHAILDQPFSVDTGELTPTLKVKRKVVQQKYGEQIAALK